jgi:hypothetical protein
MITPATLVFSYSKSSWISESTWIYCHPFKDAIDTRFTVGKRPLCCQDCEGLGPLPGQLPAVLFRLLEWNISRWSRSRWNWGMIKAKRFDQISGKTKCAALAGQEGVLLHEVCRCIRNPFCFAFAFSAVRRIGCSSSPSFTFEKVKRSNSFQEHSSVQQLTSAKRAADVWMSVCAPLSWCCATALRT